MCMNIKNRDRKEAIDKLLVYLLTRLNAEERKSVYRNRTLNTYAYESGLSIRTLREYTGILNSANLIKVSGPYHSPVIGLVD